MQEQSSADDALAILPYDVEAAISVSLEELHVPNLYGLAGALGQAGLHQLARLLGPAGC
jgi:hypothetical protein